MTRRGRRQSVDVDITKKKKIDLIAPLLDGCYLTYPLTALRACIRFRCYSCGRAAVIGQRSRSKRQLREPIQSW